MALAGDESRRTIVGLVGGKERRRRSREGREIQETNCEEKGVTKSAYGKGSEKESGGWVDCMRERKGGEAPRTSSQTARSLGD